MLAAATLAALVLTFSRAGLLASLAGLAVMGAIVVVRGGRRTATLVGLATAGVVAGTLAIALTTHFGLAYRLLAELDQSGYRAAYVAPEIVTAEPSQVVFVPVQLTNLGSSPMAATGPGRAALGYHLIDARGRPIVFESPITLLDDTLPPAPAPASTPECTRRSCQAPTSSSGTRCAKAAAGSAGAAVRRARASYGSSRRRPIRSRSLRRTSSCPSQRASSCGRRRGPC